MQKSTRKYRWTIALTIAVVPFVLRTLVPGDGLADDAWIPLYGAFFTHLIVHHIFSRQTYGWKPEWWASASHVLYVVFMLLQIDCLAGQCQPIILWLLNIYLGAESDLHLDLADPYWNIDNWILMILLGTSHLILITVLLFRPGSVPGIRLMRALKSRNREE